MLLLLQPQRRVPAPCLRSRLLHIRQPACMQGTLDHTLCPSFPAHEAPCATYNAGFNCKR